MNRVSNISMLSMSLIVIGGEAVACGEKSVVVSHRTIRSEDATIKRGLFVPLEWLRNAPLWTPEKGDPPLSISTAHDLALSWAKQRDPANSRLEVADISLRPCSELDTWYYVVTFNGAEVSTVAVLFDGTLIGMTQID